MSDSAAHVVVLDAEMNAHHSHNRQVDNHPVDRNAPALKFNAQSLKFNAQITHTVLTLEVQMSYNQPMWGNQKSA